MNITVDWSEFANSLTTRQRAALIGVVGRALEANPDDTDIALLEPFAAALQSAQADTFADWSVLDDYGPLSRDALLVRLGQIDRLMDRCPNDYTSGTNGLVIALLRYLQSDPELYARALATARVAVEIAAHSPGRFE